MTFLSAAEDLELRTLSALPGALARLAYLEGLYEQGTGFRHWGMERVHGREKSSDALRRGYENQVGQLVARDVRSLWREWTLADGLELSELPSKAQSARSQLSPIRAAHLNLVFETLAALETARQQQQAA